MTNLHKNIYFIAALILILLVNSTCNAQLVTVNAELDSNEIVIGDQVKFNIYVVKNKNAQVQFPLFGETLGDDVEIISLSTIDSTDVDDKKNKLNQQLTVTAFDTGLFYIPPIDFYYQDENITDTFQSQATYLAVYPVELDSTLTVRDIRGNYEIPLKFSEIYPYILIALAIVAFVVFFIYYTKTVKPQQVVAKKNKPKEAAHVIALRDLDKLKKEKLWQKNLIKEYYTRLTDILRIYIEDRFEVMAMEQTTEEILFSIRNNKDITKDNINNLRNILITADFVKFAKAEPEPDENDECLDNAYTFIRSTIYSTPKDENQLVKEDLKIKTE